MSCRLAVLLFIAVGVITIMAGCAPGSPPSIIQQVQPPPPISVLFLGPPPSSMAITSNVLLTAAVANDTSSTSSVTWSVTCSSAGGCGAFNPSQVPSGVYTTYTAPSAIPSGGKVTVTATSVTDTTKSISATITITPPQPITVSIFGVPPASLQINAIVPIRAQITNDISANPEVQWTATCSSGSCGSFNPTSTTSEAGTNYTAPSAIPSGNIVTVTATSVTDPTKSASANITITKTAAPLANGTYVFHLSGPVGYAANFISGVIVAQDGAITSGEQDYISFALDQTDEEYLPLFDPISSGTYITTPDGNLQITLNVNDSAVGSETINGVIISTSRVLITGANGFSANGTLDLQSSKAEPSGGYAFSTFGVDLYGQPAGIGGILNIDSAGGISGAGSVLDISDNFTVSPAQTLGRSSVSPPDQYGRVVFQLFPSSTTLFSSLYLAGYIVDANHIRLVETTGDSFQGVVGGTALSQGANSGTFNETSLAGSSYVFGGAGEDMSGSVQVAGVFTANTGGTLTGTLNWNNLTGKGTQIPIAFTGSYTVDPTGRATLSNVSDGSTFKYQLQLYLTGSSEGLLLSSDTGNLIAGRALQQQTGSFTAASFNGSYGLNATQAAQEFGALRPNTAVGPVTAVAGTGSDTLTGFVDFGSGTSDVLVSGNVTAAANGIFTGSVAGLNAASYTTPDNFTFYLVDSTRIVVIETDVTQLTLGSLELQQ